MKKNPNILTIKTVPKRNKVNFNHQKCYDIQESMYLKTKVKPKKLSKSFSGRGNKSSETMLGKFSYFSLANDKLDFYPLKR